MNDQEIVEYLRGTCNAIYELTEKEQARFDNAKFCAYLDSEIFHCTQCGWWCDIDEEASSDHGLDELTCLQCCEEEHG